jgi:hypothetical protein
MTTDGFDLGPAREAATDALVTEIIDLDVTVETALLVIVDVVVAAAVPHIERAIRDRIADEIEQIPWDFDDPFTWRDAMSEAARVARGGEAATND